MGFLTLRPSVTTVPLDTAEEIRLPGRYVAINVLPHFSMLLRLLTLLTMMKTTMMMMQLLM